MLKNYAQLLCHYCIEARKHQRILIKTTDLAIPLVKEVYKELLSIGCYVETDISFEDQDRLFYDYANDEQLKTPSVFYKKAIEEFDGLIRIIAPHNLKSTASIHSNKKKIHHSQYLSMFSR